jgi:ketosteroid isomerase-like protein
MMARFREDFMDTNATTDDDVKAIKKLAEEFFAGVNADDLDRRMATMDPMLLSCPPSPFHRRQSL